MLFWDKKLDKLENIEDIKNLPNYGFLFFFKNIGPFKPSFILLSIICSLSTICKFFGTYIIAQLLSNISNINAKEIFTFYAPIYVGLILTWESLDYFIRKYSEAFPTVFTEYASARFYKTILNSNFHNLFSYSKEELNTIVSKYLSGVQKFLSTWVWQLPGILTNLFIVFIILAFQSPYVLLFNIVYISVFLFMSFKISAKYSTFAKSYAKQTIDTTSTIQSFTLNLSTIKRLFSEDFFVESYKSKLSLNWNVFKSVRDFHAKRWILQLNLYNFIYAATFLYGVYQVVEGKLEIGFLLLIKWSYDQLWRILVFFIEEFAVLVQQKEESKISKAKFIEVLDYDDNKKVLKPFPIEWNEISLHDVEAIFKTKKGDDLKISIPEFSLKKKSKIGIIGESGSGKSTLFNIMIKQLRFRGKYEVDGNDLNDILIDSNSFSLINSYDPFFNISIRDNLLLGKSINEDRLDQILEGCKLKSFIPDLNSIIGKSNINFSAGQLQRLRIARGLVSDSQVYLLDEPFNGIDNENKSEIMAFLKKFLKNKTLILVTHHESELELVEETYLMKDSTLKKI